MDQYQILKGSPLFQGLGEEEIASMLKCLSAWKKRYKKGEYIFRSGEKIFSMGFVLNGMVHMIKEDFWGARIILGQASCGNLFGESYACVRSEPMEVSVLSAEPSEILFLDIRKTLTVCSSACEFHSRLIMNLLSVIAEKNLMLTKKVEHMAKKTLREKILSYLSTESLRQGSFEFTIPYNRQQLADYLSVDRSALSNELSKLKKEGVLEVEKNLFHLKNLSDRLD